LPGSAAWAMSLFALEAAGSLELQKNGAEITGRSSDVETVAHSSEHSDEAELFTAGSARSDEQRQEDPERLAATSNPGSMPHSLGRCSPCAWFWKPVGCRRGPNCDHCHLCPEDERKNRKKKKQAAMPGRASVTLGGSPVSFQAPGFALNLSDLLWGPPSCACRWPPSTAQARVAKALVDGSAI